MISSLMKRINLKLFRPQEVLLGRWSLKHNPKDCEKYITNYYGEPGYPNTLKSNWIEKISKSERKC